jgi:hypothetical protein
MNDITKIKEENKFYIPNFSLVFEEYLDIFTVFHSKERVYSFLKKLFVNAEKFVEENKINDLPSPIQSNETNPYVLGVDYGFFLKNLIDFIIEYGGIINENEKEKVKNLVYLYFGVSFKNYKLNFSAQVLMKRLFGEIYGITTYKITALKGNIFYPFYYENRFGEIYQINLFYIKRSVLFNLFLNQRNRELYTEFLEKNKAELISKINKNNVNVIPLFDVEKKVY